jgi:hypothetical protein
MGLLGEEVKDIAAEQPALVRSLASRELVPRLETTGDPWLKEPRA